MENLIIILLHGGHQHNLSHKILKYIDKKNIEGITKLCVVDEEMKNIIQNNKKNIKITEMPCLIIYRDNNVSEVYPATRDNVKYILDQLKHT